MQEGHLRQESGSDAGNGHAFLARRRFRFASFTYDADRQQLLGPHGVIVLTPKPLALLECLLVHPQSVASKDVIMQSVWGTVVVTEDSIVQAVRELRAALGDTQKQLVKTVHRRGYMLGSPVEEEVWNPPATEIGSPPHPTSSTPNNLAPAPAGADRPPTLKSPDASSLRRKALAIFVVLISCLVLSVWLALGKNDPVRIDEGIASRRALSVLPFEDSTTGADRTLGAWIASQIEAKVMLRQGMRVVTQSGAVLTTPATPARSRSPSALERKTQFVIYGRILQGADRVHVEAILSAVGTGESYSIGRASYATRQELENSNFADQVSSALRARYDEIEAKRAANPASRSDPVDLTLAGWREQNRSNSHDDLVNARKKFEQALGMDPTSIMASQGIGSSYLLQFMQTTSKSPALELDLAEQTVRRALELGPEVPQNLTMWGDVLMYRRQFRESVDVLQKSIEINPDYTNGHLNLAEACILIGNLDKAQFHVDVAKRLTPRDTVRLQQFAYGVYVHLALAQGREEEAYALTRRWASEYPSSGRPLIFLAMLEILRGENYQASRTMARHLELLPSSSVDYYLMMHPSPDAKYLAVRDRLVSAARRAGLPEKTPALAR